MYSLRNKAISLLAQVVYRVGRIVGRHEAKVAMRTNAALVFTDSGQFAEFVRSRKNSGRTEAEIAQELGIKTSELRAMYHTVRNRL